MNPQETLKRELAYAQSQWDNAPSVKSAFNLRELNSLKHCARFLSDRELSEKLSHIATRESALAYSIGGGNPSTFINSN
tara:strand:+ start:1163 stop:1399 length:237 start_codon:yes stop_codon:yes gene_type:complete